MNRPRLLRGLALLALALFVIIAIAAWFAPREAAAAWLTGFVLVAGIPIGALSLRLIGRLTGGIWFTSIEPALDNLSLLVPVVGLAAVVLLVAAPVLYPWATHGAHDASIGAYYLNTPLFVLRTVLAFAGWTVLAFDITPVTGPRGQIAAGLGLVFHAIITTFVAYDWVLALTPGFTSSAFGAETVIVWLLGALATATILSSNISQRASYDLAGLLVAGVMGTGYMVFFQFLIVWYGDLPDTAKFYMDRDNALGITLIVAALLVGLVVPMLAFAFEPVRASIHRVRIVCILILAGLALYRGWCVLPLFGPVATILAPVVALFLAASIASASRWVGSLAQGETREARHGG